MGAAVRDLLGQAGTLLFQSLPGRSPGGGSDPGSLSAGTAEPEPYQQLYRAAVQGLAVYHSAESLLRPAPPGGKRGAAAQHLFPGRGQCRTGFRTGHGRSRQSAGSAHPGRAAAVHPALYSGLQCQRDRSAALSPARHGPQPPCPDTPSPQN